MKFSVYGAMPGRLIDRVLEVAETRRVESPPFEWRALAYVNFKTMEGGLYRFWESQRVGGIRSVRYDKPEENLIWGLLKQRFETSLKGIIILVRERNSMPESAKRDWGNSNVTLLSSKFQHFTLCIMNIGFIFIYSLLSINCFKLLSPTTGKWFTFSNVSFKNTNGKIFIKNENYL